VPYGSIRTSPRVKAGRQFRADRSLPAARDHNVAAGDAPRVFRKNPGPGHRHVLMVRHVRAFVAILPDWPTLSVGLNAIGLVPPYRPGVDGFHRAGLVAVCSCPRDLCRVVDDPAYLAAHRGLLDRLGVPVETMPDGQSMIGFTERTLRAFQLLHVLLHELGHHHDRMTSRSQRGPSRGESFAERYAMEYGDRIWDRYFDAFPD
jgi:hypothetical protein